MYKSFKNILIPVDFTINTEVAVKKALELADPDPTIHLLYIEQENALALSVMEQGFSYNVNTSLTDREIIEKLAKLKKLIIEKSGPDNIINVHSWFVKGKSVQNSIEEKAKEIFADLIIIGKNSSHSWIPLLNTVTPSLISYTTNIPVLTVKPGSKENKIKNVIVPVTGNGTQNKLGLIAALCRKFKLTVHLVTFNNKKNKEEGLYASVLWQYYQLINALRCPVKYVVLSDNNTARGLLKYTEEIDGDMILVHPEVETKIGWSKHISDMLPADSKIQVCSV